MINVFYMIEYGVLKILIFWEVLEKMYVDLIMIGVIGLNVVERILIGLVIEYVIWMVICDVFVVWIDFDN